MQSKQTIITLVGAAILLLFALAVISFVPPAPTIHALAPSLQDDPQPHVGFDTLDDSVPAGEYAYAGLLFASFPCIDQNNDNKCNHKDKFTTVTYRFDILQGGADADNCEGQGLGSVRNFSPSYYDSWRTSGPSPLRIARNCPTGAYTMKCTVTYTEPGSDVAIPIACNSRDFTVGPPRSQDPPTATPTETPIPTPIPTPTETPIPTAKRPPKRPYRRRRPPKRPYRRRRPPKRPYRRRRPPKHPYRRRRPPKHPYRRRRPPKRPYRRRRPPKRPYRRLHPPKHPYRRHAHRNAHRRQTTATPTETATPTATRRLSKITGKTRRKRTQPRRPRLRPRKSPRPSRGSTVCLPPSIKASKLPST